jgi:CheY-like chemotaxis protein
MSTTRLIPRDVLLNWDILVVDDDEVSRRVAATLLKHYGASIRTAGDGAQALKAVEQQRPRFVLADLSMPVMDGWTLLENIKKAGALADLPVIALTAHAMVGDRERGLEAGFVGYLTKPLVPASFVRDLISVLKHIPALAVDLKHIE